MREDARQRATEFVKELYAAGEIDADRSGTGVAEVLAARSEAELAQVVRSLPTPVALTSQERRLAEPLEIHTSMAEPAFRLDQVGLAVADLAAEASLLRLVRDREGGCGTPWRSAPRWVSRAGR
jgi:uncharacterized protein DUF1707